MSYNTERIVMLLTLLTMVVEFIASTIFCLPSFLLFLQLQTKMGCKQMQVEASELTDFIY